MKNKCIKNGVCTRVQDVNIPFKVKSTFAISGLGLMLGSTLITSFAMFYYTTVIGISGSTIGTILLVSKLWDFFDDPIQGMLIDRTKSKEGRCRFWIKYAAVPGAIALAMVFMMPNITIYGKLVWIVLTYILHCTAHSMLVIPSNALIGRITSNKVERSKINQFYLFGRLAGSYMAVGITLPLANAIGGDNLKKGFIFVGIIVGIIYAVCNLTLWKITKNHEPLEYLQDECYEDLQCTEKEEVKSTSIIESLKSLLNNTHWILCILISLMSIMAEGLEGTARAHYYMYYLKSTNLLTMYSILALSATIIGLLTASFFVKRFGNAGTMMLGCMIQGLSFLLRFILKDGNLLVWGIGNFIGGFGGALISATTLLCLLDSRAFGKLKNNVDNDAVLMSGSTIASKVGFAVSSSIAAFLLDTVNFIPNAIEQSQAVLSLFIYESTLIPGIFMIIGCLCAFNLCKYEKQISNI